MREHFKIIAPCDVAWDAMPGDDRVRFCDQCRKSVYNTSALTAAEANRLVAQADGGVCVHIETPTGRPRGERRWFLRAALVFLTATVSSLGLRGQVRGGSRTVRVFVTAGSGEILISGARVEFLNLAGNSVGSCTTDEKGECALDLASEGMFKVSIQAPGFEGYKADVGSASEVRAKLQVGSSGGGILVKRHFWNRS